MGPLAGLKVIEMAGLAPGPFCAMMLADMGAEVLRIERPNPADAALGIELNLLNRGKETVAIDLKSKNGIATLARLISGADAFIEGFRPGVMERLGLGPDVCFAANPRLVYGRVTGWGQDGPLAQSAGHDLNYIALTGVLHSIGRNGEPPVPPLNLVGDFAGGGLYLAFGLVCAIFEARQSGRGQVVDAAMIDGAASLMTYMCGFRASNAWSDVRGENVLDGSAPWYTVYETADGKYITVAAAEGKFYAELLRLTGLDGEDLPAQHDRKKWPVLRARFAEVFVGKSRDEWCALLGGSDACFAPVLTIPEAAAHPHNRARKTFIEVDGVEQPAPAPRFSRSIPDTPHSPTVATDVDAVLARWGFGVAEIGDLRRERVIV